MSRLSSLRFGSVALLILCVGCGPEPSGVFGSDHLDGDGAGGNASSSGGSSSTGATGSGASSSTGASGSGASGSGGSGNGSSTGGGSSTGTGTGTGGAGSCAHSPCAQGGPLDPSCDVCTAKVCSEDDFCCTQEWDDACVELAVSQCGDACDDPNCVTCSQALQGQMGNLCAGAAQLLETLNECVCSDKCIVQCTTTCTLDVSPGPVCQNCVSNQCGGELNDCFSG